MLLGQGRHLHGIVRDERRLDVRALAVFAEDFVDEFALAHGLVRLHAQGVADGAYLVLALAAEVVARLLADGLEDGQAAVGGLETDDLAIDLDLGLAVDGGADALEQLLGERHHPLVVLVGHVELDAGKLGVVALVHALVAEVLSNLIHAVKSAYDEALEVELGGDAQVEVRVERIVVRDEGACAGAAGDGLEDRRFHLHVARLVQGVAHFAEDGRALDEGLADALVDDEVHVALSVAQFGVVEGVVGYAVLFLDHGQGLDALGQDGQLLGVHGDFARLCAEDEAFDADVVAQVEQLFEHRVVEVLILFGADVVAGDIHLYAARGVLQFHKTGLAHDASSHHASGDAHLTRLGVVRELGADVVGVGRHRIFGGGVGVDAGGAERFEAVAAADFLFA